MRISDWSSDVCSSDLEGVEAAARDISGRVSAVHILINKAGIFTAGNVEDVKADQWDRELCLNLRAPFFLVQALLPKLKAASQPGDPARVINIGSIGALWGRSSNGAYAYGAAKAGIHQLTRIDRKSTRMNSSH